MHQTFTWFPSLNWRKCTGADTISKLTAVYLLWRHRYMNRPLVIMSSQWPIAPMGFYGRMMLTSVSGGDVDNLRSRELFGRWRHNFACRGRIWNTGHLRDRELFAKWRHSKLPKGNGANNWFDHIAAAGGKPELCTSWLRIHFLVLFLCLPSFSFSSQVYIAIYRTENVHISTKTILGAIIPPLLRYVISTQY